MKDNKKEPIIPDSLTDEELGKEVRSLAKYLWNKEIPQFKDVRIMASLYNIIRSVESMNVGTVTMEVSGWHSVDNPEIKTDYIITVKSKSETV